MSISIRRTAPVIGALVATLASPSALRAQRVAAPAALASPVVLTVPAQAPVANAAAEPVPAAAAAAPVAAQRVSPARIPPGASTPAPAAPAAAAIPEDDQDAPPPPPPPAAPAPPVAARASTRVQPPRPPNDPDIPGQYVSKGINIRIDATITESRGDQVLGKKVVSVTVVDGRSGQVRSTQQVPYHLKGTNGFSYQNAPLNMDAQAVLRDDGRVLVSLTLDYRGGAPETGTEEDATPPPPERISGTVDQGIRQSVGVVLESGKPLIVAQSADAVGDRRVALELKATVLK